VPDGDFDPGFATDLATDQEHVPRVAVFSDDAETATCSLAVAWCQGEVPGQLRIV